MKAPPLSCAAPPIRAAGCPAAPAPAAACAAFSSQARGPRWAGSRQMRPAGLEPATYGFEVASGSRQRGGSIRLQRLVYRKQFRQSSGKRSRERLCSFLLASLFLSFFLTLGFVSLAIDVCATALRRNLPLWSDPVEAAADYSPPSPLPPAPSKNAINLTRCGGCRLSSPSM